MTRALTLTLTLILTVDACDAQRRGAQARTAEDEAAPGARRRAGGGGSGGAGVGGVPAEYTGTELAGLEGATDWSVP